MSAVQVMAQSGAGAAADRTPFFGIKTPLELKKLIQLAKTLDISVFKKVVKCKSPCVCHVTYVSPVPSPHTHHRCHRVPGDRLWF